MTSPFLTHLLWQPPIGLSLSSLAFFLNVASVFFIKDKSGILLLYFKFLNKISTAFRKKLQIPSEFQVL